MAKAEFCIGESDYKHGYWQEPAPKQAVEYVLKQRLATKTYHDGRSRWMWIRLPDGDLVLAIYPQGDTYFKTDQWHTI
jgi:hypothetical protein